MQDQRALILATIQHASNAHPHAYPTLIHKPIQHPSNCLSNTHPQTQLARIRHSSVNHPTPIQPPFCHLSNAYPPDSQCEWEGGLKVDSATSLPYSARNRGRVWRGGSVGAISGELIARLIGYFEVEQGIMIARHCVHPDHGLLGLSNPSSNRQL